MAKYNQVKYGSSGNDVLELQKQLNSKGYSLDEDGIFGSATQGAVRDYQTKNNLTVDGVVGDQTWGSLYSAATTQPDIELPKYDYTQGDSVTQAQKLYEQHLAQKPGEYQSQYQPQINEKLQQYLDREDFQYDINADALYRQYADRYIQQGKMAMMDTMGQAAAMTGGYGNSYAQTAGQQAYQGYLQGLNDIVPELQQQAWERYQAEGDKMLNEYSLLSAQEQQDYSRYQDQLSSWLTERDHLAGRYDSERDYDYGKYVDDRDFRYGQQQTEQDKLISLITTTGYKPTDKELTTAGMTREQAQAYLSYYQDENSSTSVRYSPRESSDNPADPAEDEDLVDETLPLDKTNLIALGFEGYDEDTLVKKLDEYVRSGKLIEYEQDGKLKFMWKV